MARTKLTNVQQKDPYKFNVYRSAAQSLTDNAWNTILADTALYDTGSNVDLVTNKGRFTAPVAGFYQLNGSAGVAAIPANTLTSISFWKNGTQFITGFQGYTGGTATDNILQVATIIQLAVNDYIELRIYNGTTGKSLKVDGASTFNSFSGFLVSTT